MNLLIFSPIPIWPGYRSSVRVWGDPELIMAAGPDVIFMTSTTAGEADALQKQTGIPVFTIEYGDLGRNRPTFYNSLQLIGQVLHTEDKVDSLIGFIDEQIADLQARTAGTDKSAKVYVGGISYKGQKGITSTDPYYAALIIWKPTMWLLNSIRPTYPR